jgi:predicted nucleic acid-binding protein
VIVVDASAVVELLLQTELGVIVERRLYGDDADLHAPHLLDVEVQSALRRLVHAGEVPPERGRQAIEDLGLLRVTRHGHIDLAARCWELRASLSTYDAVYVALAESLDASLLTCDAPLGAAVRKMVRVEVVRRGRE